VWAKVPNMNWWPAVVPISLNQCLKDGKAKELVALKLLGTFTE